MGCDIHAYTEVRDADGKWACAGEELDLGRDYHMFGFLADVRNYSHSPVIAAPRGLPEDVSPAVRGDHEGWRTDAHSASWLSLAELLAYDYDQIIWDRRIERQVSPNRWDGAALAEEGEGEHLPLREFLGEFYFRQLDRLADLGPAEDVRLVFWFDN